MAGQDSRLTGLAAYESSAKPQRQRSALGIGVTTLVTIIVVMLLTAFAVLSLVSARSNLRLSEMSMEMTQSYYAADSEATRWYAELDAFVATLEGSPSEYAEQLRSAGYEVQVSATAAGEVNGAEAGELRVTNGFTLNENRTLMVTIAVNDDRTTAIRQWQS